MAGENQGQDAYIKNIIYTYMKYLKLFEDVNQGYEQIESTNGYVPDEMRGVVLPKNSAKNLINYDNISDREVSDIKDIMSYDDIVVESRSKGILKISIFRKDSNVYKQMDISISKDIDEWYYVIVMNRENGSKHKYYKCDQLNGLLNLLKSI